MEKDKIVTYKIDDTSITKDKSKRFKVFYTLERKDGNISYCLENFDGQSLNINEMNGNENMLLNMCFSNFYNNKDIPINYKDLITIEEVPRAIKQGQNIRYELYKDLCYSRGTSPSNLGYILTINKWSEDFENDMLKSAISDSEMFNDYIEYKVLSEIVQKEASEKGSYGNLEATMSYYLGKYKIKDFKENKIINTPMYNRIKNVYDKALTKKVLDGYDELFEKIPELYKVKYYNILKPDENKDEFENYYDLNIKKTILENIEKLESIDSKVKVLVLWSEKFDIFGTWDSLNQKDDPKVYTLKEMDRLVYRNYMEVTEKDSGYDKTRFLIFVDTDENVVLSANDRIDVGDPYTNNFTNFMKNCYGKAYVKELSEFDSYLKNQLNIEEEEEI